MAENDIQTLFRRAELLLEDGEWVRATSCYNNILDIEPENAKAHIGILLAALRIKSEDELKTCPEMFDDNKNYLRAVEFADDEYKAVLQNYCIKNIQFNAEETIKNAKKADDYEAAIDILLKISEQVDVSERIEFCEKKSSEAVSNKKNKIRKTINGIIIAIIVIVVITIIGVVSKSISNQHKAEIIQQNLIGCTFSGETEDDDGFYYDYKANNLNEYKIYCHKVRSYKLVFNEDGTVDHYENYKSSVLAYPKAASKEMVDACKDEWENNGTSKSYSVSVSLNGDILLNIYGEGSKTHEVQVDSDLIPQKIYSFGLYDDVDVDISNYSK